MLSPLLAALGYCSRAPGSNCVAAAEVHHTLQPQRERKSLPPVLAALHQSLQMVTADAGSSTEARAALQQQLPAPLLQWGAAQPNTTVLAVPASVAAIYAATTDTIASDADTEPRLGLAAPEPHRSPAAAAVSSSVPAKPLISTERQHSSSGSEDG